MKPTITIKKGDHYASLKEAGLRSISLCHGNPPGCLELTVTHINSYDRSEAPHITLANHVVTITVGTVHGMGFCGFDGSSHRTAIHHTVCLTIRDLPPAVVAILSDHMIWSHRNGEIHCHLLTPSPRTAKETEKTGRIIVAI